MSVFSSVRGNNVGRSVFNLSHFKRFTCDMGQLIPVLFLECVPGDTMKIGCEAVTRFQPMVAPILDSVDMYVHYFFVPTRLLMDNDKDWETFLTGGKDGIDDSISIPTWTFNTFNGTPDGTGFPFSNGIKVGKYSLWDYFGLPVLPSAESIYAICTSNHVMAFPQRSYNLVWNEYYRDENLVDEVDKSNSTILYRAWKKDYFTSSLPWQQRGISPALPISGTIPVNLNGAVLTLGSVEKPINLIGNGVNTKIGNEGSTTALKTNDQFGVSNYFGIRGEAVGSDVPMTVNLENASTFDVAVLREAFQIQRWLELNARAGVRYTEFLKAHFGLAPRDEVLQRPEYIGGTKSSIVVSEVLQTSSTVQPSPDGKEKGSPQGNLAGHGLGAMSDFICSYTAKEFGYIIGIASWMPKPSYQQGVNRMFSRRTKYDWYFPEFSHLSEQSVTKGEVYATGDDQHDNAIFGYQSCYAEMKYMPSMNCADMRDTFSYWHLGRKFSSDPSLNAGFLTTNSAYSGGIRKDIFAVQNEPGLIVNFANVIKAIRPMPVYGTPGFIDHVSRM